MGVGALRAHDYEDSGIRESVCTSGLNWDYTDARAAVSVAVTRTGRTGPGGSPWGEPNMMRIRIPLAAIVATALVALAAPASATTFAQHPSGATEGANTYVYLGTDDTDIAFAPKELPFTDGTVKEAIEVLTGDQIPGLPKGNLYPGWSWTYSPSTNIGAGYAQIGDTVVQDVHGGSYYQNGPGLPSKSFWASCMTYLPYVNAPVNKMVYLAYSSAEAWHVIPQSEVLADCDGLGQRLPIGS